MSKAVRDMYIKKHQLGLADCEDANGNTPLSEASAGGHVSTIKMLLQKGAEINSRGRYERTPLWRAAFAGHLESVLVIKKSHCCCCYRKYQCVHFFKSDNVHFCLCLTPSQTEMSSDK